MDSPHTADIVERLNEEAIRTTGVASNLMAEAAAEIKALRADNAELVRVAKEQTEVIAELEDELAALKDYRKVRP